VFVQGRLQKNEKFAKVIADHIVPMEQVEELWSASVHLTIDALKTDARKLNELHEVLKNYSGKCTGFLHVVIPEKTETVIELPEEMKLRAGTALTGEVNRLLGYASVATHCSVVPQRGESVENNGKVIRGRF
jgi:DNA polymerase-3 subunit alpha